MPNPLLLCPPTQSLALEVAWSVINHRAARESGIPGEIHDELDDDWKSSQAVIIHRAQG